MTLFQSLKRNARLALQGNWPKAIGAPLVLTVCWGLLTALRQYALDLFAYLPGGYQGNPGAFSFSELLIRQATSQETVILALFLLLLLLLEAPLLLGIRRWYYKMTGGEAPPFAEVFTYFDSLRKYGKSLWLFVSVFARALLWAFAFLGLPGLMLFLSSGIVNGRLGILPGQPGAVAVLGTMAVVISGILLLLAIVLYAVFMNRYALVFPLFFEEPDRPITHLIRESIRATKTYRLSILGFSLTFLGWFAICIAIAPLFFVVPYYLAASTLYARYIVERSRREEAAEDIGDQTREFSVSPHGPPPSTQAADSMEGMPAPAEDIPFPQNTLYGGAAPEDLGDTGFVDRSAPSPDYEEYPMAGSQEEAEEFPAAPEGEDVPAPAFDTEPASPAVEEPVSPAEPAPNLSSHLEPPVIGPAPPLPTAGYSPSPSLAEDDYAPPQQDESL